MPYYAITNLTTKEYFTTSCLESVFIRTVWNAKLWLDPAVRKSYDDLKKEVEDFVSWNESTVEYNNLNIKQRALLVNTLRHMKYGRDFSDARNLIKKYKPIPFKIGANGDLGYARFLFNYESVLKKMENKEEAEVPPILFRVVDQYYLNRNHRVLPVSELLEGRTGGAVVQPEDLPALLEGIQKMSWSDKRRAFLLVEDKYGVESLKFRYSYQSPPYGTHVSTTLDQNE